MKGINNISNNKGFLITALSASSCVGIYAGSSCGNKDISYEKVEPSDFLTNQDVKEKGEGTFNLNNINNEIKNTIDDPKKIDGLKTALEAANGIKDFVYSYYKGTEGDYYKGKDEATPKNTEKGRNVLVIKGKKDGAVEAKIVTGTKEKKGNTTATTKSK